MAAIIRPKALEYLRNLVAEGIKQRDLFLNIVIDQDDWLGALSKPESYQQAVRLDLAQTTLLRMASDPSVTVEKMIYDLEADLDTMALNLSTPSMFTRFRKAALEEIIKGLGGTQRLAPRV